MFLGRVRFFFFKPADTARRNRPASKHKRKSIHLMVWK